jgi:targeting protein for Xklp2
MSGLVREYIFISKPNSHIILLLSDNKIDDDDCFKTPLPLHREVPPPDVRTIPMVTMEKAEPLELAGVTDSNNDDEEETNKGEICVKTIRRQAKEIKKRMQSERKAALKATQSIQSMLRPSTNKSIKTTEERELDKIQQLKHQADKNKKISNKSFKSLMLKQSISATSRFNPVKPKPLTESVEFSFKTDERLKAKKATPTAGSGCGSSNFPMNLRSSERTEYLPNDPSEKKPCTPKMPTKVQPFKFRTEERLRSKVDRSTQEKYVSAAEYTEKFETKTPPRFRSKLKLGSERRGVERKAKGATPKTPNLQSQYRVRNIRVTSQAEREEMELEEQKKYKFKAQPVKPEVFSKPNLPQPSTHPPTTAVSPQLTTKERIGSKRSHAESEDKDLESKGKKFKAFPVPKDMFTKITGVPEKRPNELTVPHSPLITKKRKTEDCDNQKEVSPVKSIKAFPAPKTTTNVFHPNLDNKKTTEVKPFSFDGKYTSKSEKVEQMIKEVEEKLAKQREFLAHPMPVTPSLPAPRSIPSTTVVKPFHLMTEERGQEYVQRFNEKVEEMKVNAIEAAQFKATESKSVYCEPVLPPKITRPLTEVNSFDLQTEVRAGLRAEFEEGKKVREREKMEIEEEREMLRKKEEEEELKRLRKTLVHKAQPIHQYDPVIIQPSTKPLTMPVSPLLTAGFPRVKDKENNN